jgi:hypothetical protein
MTNWAKPDRLTSQPNSVSAGGFTFLSLYKMLIFSLALLAAKGPRNDAAPMNTQNGRSLATRHPDGAGAIPALFAARGIGHLPQAQPVRSPKSPQQLYEKGF